jgi:hypothetical protein
MISDPGFPGKRLLGADGLILITGAGGFVAGALTRYFPNL